MDGWVDDVARPFDRTLAEDATLNVLGATLKRSLRVLEQ